MLKDDLLRGGKAAAEFMGVSPHMVYRMAAAGQIPSFKLGNTVCFRKSEIEKALRSVA